jgi:GNAT superfamily N-acetyltransferase
MNACVTKVSHKQSEGAHFHRKPRMTFKPSAACAIRDATEGDASAVFDLICFKAEFDGCLSSVLATPRTLVAAMRGTSPYFRALLAEVGGKPVGFASFHQTFSSFLAQPGIWLDDLYVRESHRGQGVGKALMRRLAMLAANNGCARIDWIVGSSNGKARAFHRHLGVRVNEDVGYCRLDAVAIADLAKDKPADTASRSVVPAPQPQSEHRMLAPRPVAALD